MAKRKRKLPRHASPPVQQGLVSPRRPVPSHIALPPYAVSGEPPPSSAPPVRTAEEIEAMRDAGAQAAEVLLRVAEKIAPGITTEALDAFAHDEIISRGAYPSPLNYKGFPKSVCTSVNEVICHGIPDSRQLQDGDIVNVDVTLYRNGVHGDTSSMFLVGDVDEPSRKLVRETLTALRLAIAVVRPGCAVKEIGRTIEDHARKHGLGVVREFIGHGVGNEFHSKLAIPHYYDPKQTRQLEQGTTFTIEPMLTLGSPALRVWDDEWTAVTKDGHRSAQFEHTLLITPDSAEILTQTPTGETAHDSTAAQVNA